MKKRLIYLRLDNTTLASYDDILEDPFLAWRTKPYGRYAGFDPIECWRNTSLFELANPPNERWQMPDNLLQVAEISGQTLYPGEKLILHYTNAPSKSVGPWPLDQGSRNAALAHMEVRLRPRRRSNSTESLRIRSAYPILKILNNDTRASIESGSATPVHSLEIPIDWAAHNLSVFSQRSRASLPRFIRGMNVVKVEITIATGAVTFDGRVYTHSEKRASHSFGIVECF